MHLESLISQLMTPAVRVGSINANYQANNLSKAAHMAAASWKKLIQASTSCFIQMVKTFFGASGYVKFAPAFHDNPGFLNGDHVWGNSLYAILLPQVLKTSHMYVVAFDGACLKWSWFNSIKNNKCKSSSFIFYCWFWLQCFSILSGGFRKGQKTLVMLQSKKMMVIICWWLAWGWYEATILCKFSRSLMNSCYFITELLFTL